MKVRNGDEDGAEMPHPAGFRPAHAVGGANVNDSPHAAQSLTAPLTSTLYSLSLHVIQHRTTVGRRLQTIAEDCRRLQTVADDSSA
jgi:hypothetical protein